MRRTLTSAFGLGSDRRTSGTAWGMRLAAALALAVFVPACGRSPSPIIIPFAITTPTGTRTLTAAVVGTAYSQQLGVQGTTGTVTYTLIAGSLPGSLGLSASGLISGTPSAPYGSFTFTVRATDAGSNVTDLVLTIVLSGGAPAALAMATPALPGATVGVAYSTGLTATGGTVPYSFAITSGALPAGLTLQNGQISGTPTTSGAPVGFTITVTDATSATASQGFTITVATLPSITSTSPFNPGTVGAAYSHAVGLSGGAAPMTWSVPAGALPAGLTIDSLTGLISGTPTTAGVSSFTVHVVDSAGAFSAVALAITINPAPTVTTAVLPAWTQGLAGYNQSLAATGGTGAYTWSVTSGALPAGLSLSAAGVISGTPTAPAAAFTVTVTDAAGGTGSQSLSITVNPPVSVTAVVVGDWTVNRPGYSVTLLATGGTGAHTWAVTGGSLPPGMSVAPATGILSGTPTVAGPYSFTATATDSLGAPGSRLFSFTINQTPSITTASLPNWTQNFAFTAVTLGSLNGTPPLGWSVTVGALPAGLSLDPVLGKVTGTPTGTGVSNFTITATDAAGAAANQAYSMTINPALSVTNTTPMQAWTQGHAGYNQTLTANVGGGTGALTWSITVGSLPTNLSLNTSTGAITGNPSAAATYNFTATVTDSIGATGQKALQIVINNPLSVQNPFPLAPWTQGFAGYSQVLTASGGTGPAASQTWAITSGALPTGLTLNSSTGQITGNPSAAAGAYPFTVTVTDTVGATGSLGQSITINNPVSITTPSPLPQWTQSFAGYSQPISASFGTGAKSFAVTGGALPGGMTLSLGGSLTGTPGGAGDFNFTVTATDTVGASGSKGFLLHINNPVVITTSSPLPQGSQGIFYSFNFLNTGGTGAIAWSTNPTPNPVPGLSVAGNTLSGTPTTGGTFSFNVTATDSVGASATFNNMQLFILAPLTITSTDPLPGATASTGYTQSVTVTGGRTAYTWSILTGTLPGTIALNPATGVLSGTAPASNGIFNFTVRVTDQDGRTADKPLSITVTGGTAGAISQSPTTLQGATSGSAYNQAVTATGGTPPYTWTAATFTPAGSGLSLGTDGHITGTAGTAGPYSVSSLVTDSASVTNTVTLNITVNPALSISTSSPLQAWTVSGPNPYNQSVSPSGGTAPYTWAIASGSIPNGLFFNTSTGSFTGTPTVSGTFNFTVQVSDASSANASKPMSITINVPPTIGTSSPLPSWDQNFAGYSFTVLPTPSTGTPPFNWSITAGALPAGLTLTPGTGLISGTPTAQGSFNPTFQISDLAGSASQSSLQIQINAPLSFQTAATLPGGTESVAYSQSVAVTPGTGTGTANFSMTGGSLPTGVSFTSGSFTGTPAVGSAGTYHPQITATDAIGATVAQFFNLTITNAPQVQSTTPANAATGINPDTTLVITFNMAMVKTEVQNNFTLSPLVNSASVHHTYVWDTPPASANGTTLTVAFDVVAPFSQITADDLLADNTTYTWAIASGAHSGTGLVMGAQSGTFKTSLDTTPPTILSFLSNSSQDPTTQVLTGSVTGFTVTFSEPMNTSTTNGSTQIQLQSPTGSLNASAGTTSGPLTVQWTDTTHLAIGFNPALTANTGYQLSLNSLNDANGNYMNNNTQYNILVKGTGVQAPSVTGTFPPNSATGVNRDSAIFIATTEPLSPDVQTRLQITAGNPLPPFIVKYRLGKNDGPQGIQVFPQAAWPASTLITVTIPGGVGGVTNASLVPLASTYQLTFTTGTTGASSGAITIDSAFSTVQNAMADCDTFSGVQGSVVFKDGTNNHAYMNGATLTNAAISVADSNGIPVKNFVVNGNGNGNTDDPASNFSLNTRFGQGVTNLQQNMTYTLTFNSTIQSSTGGSFAATPYTFTTIASSTVMPRTLVYANNGNTQAQSGTGTVANPIRTLQLQVSQNSGQNNVSAVTPGGATTAYTVSNFLPSWIIAGATVGVFGCSNAANNGSFTVASVSVGGPPFTLTLNNAAGVSETSINNAFVGAPVTITAADITGGSNTFSQALTYSGNNNSFQYQSAGDESTITTSGVHTLQFTLQDGVASHKVQWSKNVFFFTGPDMLAMTPTAPSGAGPFGGTPTYTWSGSVPANCTALLLAVNNPSGKTVFMWVIPGTPATFTQPANTPLAPLGVGQQYSWTLGYFHSVDGTIRGNGGDMGQIIPSLSFTR